jgi:hypothetical protein
MGWRWRMEEGAGEAESAMSGSGVERSEDGMQRKAVGSTGSAVGAGIYHSCGIEKKLRNKTRRKRNAFVIYF